MAGLGPDPRTVLTKTKKQNVKLMTRHNSPVSLDNFLRPEAMSSPIAIRMKLKQVRGPGRPGYVVGGNWPGNRSRSMPKFLLNRCSLPMMHATARTKSVAVSPQKVRPERMRAQIAVPTARKQSEVHGDGNCSGTGICTAYIQSIKNPAKAVIEAQLLARNFVFNIGPPVA
jgi:hypothetical protein